MQETLPRVHRSAAVASPGFQDPHLAAAEKVLAVLEAFSPTGGLLGVTELAGRAGLPKSTTFRMLQTLVDFRLVERHDRGYRLGGRLHELAALAGSAGDGGLGEHMMPLMRALRHNTDRTVRFGALAGDAVLIIEELREPRTPSAIGHRFPLHCTASGKAMLAFSAGSLRRDLLQSGALTQYTDSTILSSDRLSFELREVTRHRIAFDLGEYRAGVRCIASPVLDRTGSAVAVLSVSGSTSLPELKRLSHAVRRAAHEASRVLSRAA